MRFDAAVALRWMARVVCWLMQPRDGDGGRIWCPLQLDADELSAVWVNDGDKAKTGHSVSINVASVVRQGPNPGPGTAAAVGIDPVGAVDEDAALEAALMEMEMPGDVGAGQPATPVLMQVNAARPAEPAYESLSVYSEPRLGLRRGGLGGCTRLQIMRLDSHAAPSPCSAIRTTPGQFKCLKLSSELRQGAEGGHARWAGQERWCRGGTFSLPKTCKTARIFQPARGK